MSQPSRPPIRLASPPAPGDVLCRFDELASEPGVLGLEWYEWDGPRRVILARRADDVVAYVNECPHAFARLDSPAGNFLADDDRGLRCAFHGARFSIADGRCLAGPALGRALRGFPIRLDGEVVRMAEAGRSALARPRARRADARKSPRDA